MPRRLYSEEHEDFRATVREFVERNLKPRVEEMIELKSIPRDIWLEAGKQGLLGLDIPEEFGGAGAEDYRFNAVLAEEWAHFNAAAAACPVIHAASGPSRKLAAPAMSAGAPSRFIGYAAATASSRPA